MGVPNGSGELVPTTLPVLSDDMLGVAATLSLDRIVGKKQDQNGDLLTKGIDSDEPQIVDRALSQGVDVNRHGSVTGYTPLMQAAAVKSNRALKELLRRGANVNAHANHGGTALMVTALAGNIAGERMLLDHRAAVDAQDSNGCTALYYAVDHRNVEAVRVLLTHGADPNKPSRKGVTPLALTARKYKVSGDMSGHVTKTPLDLTARKHLTEIAGLLRRAQARR
jgi:ankyrin repeat protein